MYIEYIEKFLDKVKKAYAKLFKKNLKQPIRKKRAPQKRKPNTKNNKRKARQLPENHIGWWHD